MILHAMYCRITKEQTTAEINRHTLNHLPQPTATMGSFIDHFNVVSFSSMHTYTVIVINIPSIIIIIYTRIHTKGDAFHPHPHRRIGSNNC